jgi:hypothetical protein
MVNKRRDVTMALLRGWLGFPQADAFSGHDAAIHHGMGASLNLPGGPPLATTSDRQ